MQESATSFSEEPNTFGFYSNKGSKFFDVSKLTEKERKKVVVVNAGNSSWKLEGDGLNGACDTLYKHKTWKGTDIRFSLRTNGDKIGCDLIDDGKGFTHVYQVGPNFSGDASLEASQARLNELLFSNYATFLALMQPEMKGKQVILAGASTSIFAGKFKDIKRGDNNIINYINALCFIRFSNQLKSNGLKIYTNRELSLAIKDIENSEEKVLKWIVDNIPPELLATLGIEKEDGSYKLSKSTDKSHETFETKLLEREEDKENIRIAAVVSEIRKYHNGIPFSSLTNKEVMFWIEKFKQLKDADRSLKDRKFSEFLQEAFEQVKKTYDRGGDGNQENLNGLRHFLSVTGNIVEQNIFNPLFDYNDNYKELRFKNFNAYIQFLKNGGEGKTYRTQEDLAVMKALFERDFDISKKEEFITTSGQKVVVLTNEKGETFVIGDIVKKDETEDTLEKYIKYLKEKYGTTHKRITIIIPQTTGGHWTLLSAVVQLPAGIVSDETTYDSMQEDDPLGLGKRQRDGWSCGIYTMEAVSMVIGGIPKEKEKPTRDEGGEEEDTEEYQIASRDGDLYNLVGTDKQLYNDFRGRYSVLLSRDFTASRDREMTMIFPMVKITDNKVKIPKQGITFKTTYGVLTYTGTEEKAKRLINSVVLDRLAQDDPRMYRIETNLLGAVYSENKSRVFCRLLPEFGAVEKVGGKDIMDSPEALRSVVFQDGGTEEYRIVLIDDGSAHQMCAIVPREKGKKILVMDSLNYNGTFGGPLTRVGRNGGVFREGNDQTVVINKPFQEGPYCTYLSAFAMAHFSKLEDRELDGIYETMTGNNPGEKERLGQKITSDLKKTQTDFVGIFEEEKLSSSKKPQTDTQREPQPQTPQKRQKPKPSQEQVSSKLVEIAESTAASNPKVSQVVQSLVHGQPSSEELKTLAKPMSLEDENEEKETRGMKLRAMTVQKAIESGETISDEQASKFIAGGVSDSAQAKVLVEGQLSMLPKDFRCPNQSPKFLCEDKITLNDDGTTTVSLTFDKSQLSLPGGGKCTIKIKLPKGVLASPDLVDALRRKELGEYLERHTGSSVECDDSNVKTAFEDRFNDRSLVPVR